MAIINPMKIGIGPKKQLNFWKKSLETFYLLLKGTELSDAILKIHTNVIMSHIS